MPFFNSLLESRRFQTGVILLASCVLVGLFLITLIKMPASSDMVLYNGDVTATLSAESSVVLIGLQCTQLSWNVTHIPPDYNAPFPLQGAKQVCSPDDDQLPLFAEDASLSALPILWVNPFHLVSCVFAVFVLFLIFRRPMWLGTYGSEMSVIGIIAVVTSIGLLFAKEKPIDYTAVSWLLYAVGLGITYLYRQSPKRAFVIVCVLFSLITWGLISVRLFLNPDLVTQDERYYVSIAATASSGHGLYPSLQNYSPMPMMGGIGYLAWGYVGAYQILGPSLYSLRALMFLVGLLPLPAIFLLFRRWYGLVTAWVAVALLPTSLLYTRALSVRMDVFAISFIWWALLFADIAREKNTWRWHLATGLFIGFALQAHLHTSVTAISIGILYLIDYGRLVYDKKRLIFPRAVIVYSVGALIGLGIYIVLNVLPNPEIFLRTAGNAARFPVVKANLGASPLEQLLRSFTALDVFVQNFLTRWHDIIETSHPFETTVWVLAFVSVFNRRFHRASLPTLVFAFGAAFVGLFILNNSHILYSTHIGPLLLLCVPPFFTYGVKRSTFEWPDITPAFVLVLSAAVFPIYITHVTSLPALIKASSVDATDQEMIRFIKDHVSTECSIIGPDRYFVFELPTYSLFYSSEIDYFGRRFFNYETNAELWRTLQPDIVVGMRDEIRFWAYDMQYEEIFPHLWRKPTANLTQGCIVRQP